MGTPKKRPAQAAMPLADALFSRVQQRVLGLLYGEPNRTFYANEIISRVQSGSGAVQRELGRLKAAGLVTVTAAGNQRHYQANASAPIYDELRGIVLKTFGLADVLRHALAGAFPALRVAFVYGSVPKGSATAASDIDLMVVDDSVSYADLYEVLEGPAKQLGRAINPTVYTPAEYAKRIKAKNAFLTRVLAQPRIWLIGHENDLPPR